MRWKLDLRLQTLILLILIPSLLTATMVFGWMVYSGLYNVIMHGFEEKLRAISTVTGAFVQGEHHDQIMLSHRVTAMAYDPRARSLIGAQEPGSVDAGVMRTILPRWESSSCASMTRPACAESFRCTRSTRWTRSRFPQ